MRLTLRTLLAWRDDMLPPEEVRRIGQQVAESSNAREIEDRVQRVTRQRRLTVPPSSGADATDPNTVAEYLDDAMPADQVIEFEKKCLTSDVHLAEVASVHQILSLLGSKARVPHSARVRMYHLIQGRETLPRRAAKLESMGGDVQPVAAALPEWRPSAPPKRNGSLVRPLAALGVLLGLLAWSTWVNLRPRANLEELELAAEAEARDLALAQRKPALPPGPAEATNGALAKGALREGVATAEEPVLGELEPIGGEGAREPAPAVAPRPAAATERAVVVAVDGVALTRTPESASWNYAKASDRLEMDASVVTPKPFESEITIGGLKIRMLGASSTVLRDTSPASLELIDGRLIVESPGEAGSIRIVRGGVSVSLGLPRGARLGVEAQNEWRAGMTAVSPEAMLIYVPEGEIDVETARGERTVAGPAVVKLARDGGASSAGAAGMPAWLSEDRVSIVDAELGRQFARFIKGDVAPLARLAEAVTSDQDEVRSLALDALGEIDEFNLVVQALNTDDQPLTRRAAIATLRRALGRGEPSLTTLRRELARYGEGQDWAKLVEALLVGNAEGDVLDEATQGQLLALLTHPDVGVRELALESLMQLTRRGNAMGYDADQPTPEAIAAWTELLRPSGNRR